ncbi:unnamed protein product [Schistosoma turkestanicum]|nr:unnamed protein product [Schistosoma turkestanicum]
MQKWFLSEYVEPIEGLNRLLEVDRVTVKQIKRSQSSKLHDAVVYEALLDTSELLLKFVEKSSFAQRFWCGSNRAFDMEVRNVNGKLVMHLQRPLKCSAVICFCCPYEMKVEAPVGEPMGSIVQNYGRFGHVFYLKDWNDNINLDIKGPWFSYTCCLDLIFKIYAHGHNRSIGRIICRRDQENDSFRIDFPLDLDYRMKLLLICAAIFLSLCDRHQKPEALQGRFVLVWDSSVVRIHNSCCCQDSNPRPSVLRANAYTLDYIKCTLEQEKLEHHINQLLLSEYSTINDD